MAPPLLRRPIGRVGLVLSLTLIGGSAGLTYGVKAPPTFTARAYVVSTGASEVRTGAAGVATSASEVPTGTAGVATGASEVPTGAAGTAAGASLVSAGDYGRIATSGPVLARAALLLGGDASGLDDVKASSPAGAQVIEITASARSADRSATVANAVARALVAYGTGLHVGLDATVPARASSPDPPCDLMIGTSAGLLAGALAALLALRRPPRPTFAGPAEIEGHLGIWRARSSNSA